MAINIRYVIFFKEQIFEYYSSVISASWSQNADRCFELSHIFNVDHDYVDDLYCHYNVWFVLGYQDASLFMVQGKEFPVDSCDSKSLKLREQVPFAYDQVKLLSCSSNHN